MNPQYDATDDIWNVSEGWDYYPVYYGFDEYGSDYYDGASASDGFEPYEEDTSDYTGYEEEYYEAEDGETEYEEDYGEEYAEGSDYADNYSDEPEYSDDTYYEEEEAVAPEYYDYAETEPVEDPAGGPAADPVEEIWWDE